MTTNLTLSTHTHPHALHTALQRFMTAFPYCFYVFFKLADTVAMTAKINKSFEK